MHLVDPPQSAFQAMFRAPASDSAPPVELWPPTPDIGQLAHHDIVWPARPGGFACARGADPWIVFPTALAADIYRYLAIRMSCRAPKNSRAQVFWRGAARPGFDEQLSISFPVIADGKPHTYVLDLHEHDGLGTINHRWWHAGTIDTLRLDPLDAPGEFLLDRIAALEQDCVADAPTREALKMPPLRLEMAYRRLRGEGIEIGALQKALPVPPSSYVRYADRLTLEQARREYAELDGLPLVNPTIICEADALTPVADGSLDFVIANHVLEHLKDPLAGLREWLRVVHTGGHLYVAVPEHTNSLDCRRPVTTLEHLIADFESRAASEPQDLEHFREAVASAHYDKPQEWQETYTRALIARQYAIHFHTFTRATFSALLREAVRRFGGHLLECRVGVDGPLTEFVGILRK